MMGAQIVKMFVRRIVDWAEVYTPTKTDLFIDGAVQLIGDLFQLVLAIGYCTIAVGSVCLVYLLVNFLAVFLPEAYKAFKNYNAQCAENNLSGNK